MPQHLFSFLLLILPHFYFCHHIVSQLSLYRRLPPRFVSPLSSPSSFTVRNWIKLPPSHFWIWAHWHTGAPWVTSPLRNASISSTHPSVSPPHLLTYSLPLLFILNPLTSPLFLCSLHIVCYSDLINDQMCKNEQNSIRTQLKTKK